MKRILLFLLAIAMSLSLFSCQKYKPVESTERENTPVATLASGKYGYEVKYELFRMLFLSAKETVSGGDLSKFEGEDAAALLEEARAIAMDKILDIYTVFALCDALDIDLYSKKVDEKVEESITISVEGGYAENGTQYIEGTGSYEKYLQSLSLFYATYQTQDLMIRYSYGISAISSYFRGTYDTYGQLAEEGALEYTDADVNAFYNSEDTYRILLGFTMASESSAEAIRDKLEEFALESDVREHLLGKTMANENDVIGGLIISRHTLDQTAYSDLSEAAFSLNEGEAAVVKGKNGDLDGYFILYRARKSAENLSSYRESIEKYYVENEIGKRYDSTKTTLSGSITYTDFYKGLTLAEISMGEEKE